MASNLRPRSSSSASRQKSSSNSGFRTVSAQPRKRDASQRTVRSASTFRATSVKGRPSQGKSPRRGASQGRGSSLGFSQADYGDISQYSRSAYGSAAKGAGRGATGRGVGGGVGNGAGIGGSVGRGTGTTGPQLRGASADPVRSVSVSQVRNQARSAASKRRVPAKGIFIALIVVAVVVGIGTAVLSTTNLFPVEEVTVSGATHLTAEELTELAAVPEGATLLNIDANGISNRLSASPWVQSVTVDRIFPNTINLNITERSISAVVEVTVDNENHTQTWALSSDGMWLMEIPDQDSEEAKSIASAVYEDAANVLHINDIPYGSTPEAGSYCNNGNIENALGIIDGMTTELKDQVKVVSAFSSDSTTLTLESGVEIAFGDSNDIRDKERVCLQLLEEHPNQISYINVRSVNNPVWRSL